VAKISKRDFIVKKLRAPAHRPTKVMKSKKTYRRDKSSDWRKYLEENDGNI